MSIFLLETSSLTINRPDSGYWNLQGEWEAPETTTLIDIMCNIQPYLEGKQKLILPEGKRTMDAVFVYSKTELRTSDQFGDHRADWFTLDGNTYEIFYVENWNRYGAVLDCANHFKHVAVRRDQPSNGGL